MTTPVRYGRSEPYYKLNPTDQIARPYIPVQIQAGGRHFDTVGLIDSGADHTSFNADLLLALGLQWSDGTYSEIAGMNGQPEEARLFNLNLIVRQHRFPATVWFTKSHITMFGLLGRDSFFNAFRVGFDQRAELALLHPLAP